MAIKQLKPEPKHVLMDFNFSTIILTQQTAAKILSLLEEAEVIKSDWDDNRVNIKPNASFMLKPISNEKILGIKKAKLAGITYTQYLEVHPDDND